MRPLDSLRRSGLTNQVDKASDVDHIADLSGHGSAASSSPLDRKEALPDCVAALMNQPPRTLGWPANAFQIKALLLIGCFLIVSLFHGYFSPKVSVASEDVPITPKFGVSKILGSLAQHDAAASSSTTSSTSVSSAPTGVLEVFQLYQPVFTPNGPTNQTINNDGSSNTTTLNELASTSSCQVTLMDFSFGSSFGKPFVGNYTPPSCKFNRVVMNFTVTSKGRQFDRLALMYFGDTEVFRTSTAEPTRNGIAWTYTKDMTQYMYFWNSPQKVIFDLPNNLDANITGLFNTTLTATFFTGDGGPEPAAMIVPISAKNGATNGASVFMVPTVNATNSIALPRNINRAVFSVSACGQASEEFWWSNVLQSSATTFNATNGLLGGFSPFREVQIYIDGQMAGVHWPFPIIFTGGIVPGLWSPIVGIDAFDLREHEIDITPWLPILCDGESHTFEIKVAGVTDDGKTNGTLVEAVGASWYVTGKIFMWLDSDGTRITTGNRPTVSLPAPTIKISQSSTKNSTGANETLTYDITVTRSISVSNSVTTQNGTQLTSWTQSLSYSNLGKATDFGQVQVNNQTTNGVDQSTGRTNYKCTYSYPLYANTSAFLMPGGNFTLAADMQRGLSMQIEGTSIYPTGIEPLKFDAILSEGLSPSTSFPGTSLVTSQNGSASIFQSPSTNFTSGFSRTAQRLSFSGVDTQGGVGNKEVYSRDVLAINSTVVSDSEKLVGQPISRYAAPEVDNGGVLDASVSGVRAALGRGPDDSANLESDTASAP
ncbi:hypothetical protein BP5796_02605 [Coleophoma crateriformis]|uniref:Peptide N-acetyl-beta-D-glucosaminyl asparaginase amidase A N-terminal domain-containing protein n=1 Tax=Coleophoma crateriformis TaxID=565419 RepID=A0A3D8SYT0_9HELO|nr:hypothetical protein BP5796_02605 [Coleophoma crateriformis]